MKVTNDKYEYPVEIADSAGQLAIKYCPNCGARIDEVTE